MPLNITPERSPFVHDTSAADLDTAGVRATPTRVRRRVWEIMEGMQPGDMASRRVGLFILSLLALNVAAVILESVRSVEERFGDTFDLFEAFSVLVFLGEYVARLWSCVEAPGSHGGVRGRVRWALRPMALVDLVAIVPFVITLGTVDMRVLRALRLFRLVWLLKAGRYLAALTVMRRVVHAKREELVMSTALTCVLLIVASSVMYFAENGAQPDKFSSIPASMWWAVCTLTTVGYGDVYPVTVLGQVAGGVLALLGIGLFALPTAILGAGWVEAVQGARPPKGCPHCGKPLH